MVAGYKYLTRRNINCDICGHTPKYHSKYGVNCGKIGKKIFVNKTKAADTQLKKKTVRLNWKPFLELGGITNPKRIRAGQKILNRLFNLRIHSAVEEARREIEKEIRGMKEGKIDIVKLKAEGIVNLQSWAEGYDQALQDVIDLISHKKLYEKKTT